MSAVVAPPGLGSISSKRRQRHKRGAIKQSLENGLIQSETSSSASACSAATSVGTDANEVYWDDYYIGEPTNDVAVQTDLSAPLQDSLQYIVDPVI